MKLPDKCPHCGVDMNLVEACWIIRTELDFDSNEPDRVEDQIFECNMCHTLFRARWKLISFTQLKEIEEGEKP